MSKLVYFMRPVGQIGPIKIGCSRMPQQRLETLSIVSPVRLEIVCAVPGSHLDERKLHGMFAAHWLHHEWFGASKELLAVVEYAAAHGELPPLPEVVPLKIPRNGRCKAVRKAPPKKGPTKEVLELGLRAKTAYEAGEQARDIAAREGVGEHAIRYALHRVGAQMRKRGVPEKGPRDTDRAEEFKRRYLAGETLAQIGDSHGVTRERVRQILRKFGVVSLGHRKGVGRLRTPLTESDLAAAKMYEAGMRPKEIFAAFPEVKRRLNHVLVRLNIPRKTTGEWLVRPDDAERTAEVSRLYQSGLSAKEIVQRLPSLRHAETVYRYLKKAGVPARCERGGGKRWENHGGGAAAQAAA